MSMAGTLLCRFGTQAVGTRYGQGAQLPSNHPHWNPGPGQYSPATACVGSHLEIGADAPSTVFGAAGKLVTPQSNLSATVYVSSSHARKENVGVHSPGPAHYDPGQQSKTAAYTCGAKAASYFDAFLDPKQQSSPGPVYNTADMDRHGKRCAAMHKYVFCFHHCVGIEHMSMHKQHNFT